MSGALSGHGPGGSTLLPSTSLSVGRVWSLPELEVLHALHKPVSILVSGAYEDPHSEGGIQYTSRVVLQNNEAQLKFGRPRSAAAYKQELSKMTEEARHARWNWLMDIHKGDSQVQSWLDVHALLRPVFDSVPSTPCFTRLDSKPIQIESQTGRVETAVLHILEGDPNTAEMRVSAMHQVNPLHTFMFNKQGRLLTANTAAAAACKRAGSAGTDKPNITLWDLFQRGNYPGGQEEAETALEEAVTAIFSLELERHCHVQPYISLTDGRRKWAMIEMSPMIDPLDGTPAVLVQRYNITQQKELELQLSLQQEALQRHNQELEQDAADKDQENALLHRQADSLAQRLEAVLNDKFEPRTGFDADTPIDKTLNFLHTIITGGAPGVQAAMDLYHILSTSNTNLRQPISLEEQLLEDEGLDTEVGQSMLQLLQGARPPPLSVNFERAFSDIPSTPHKSQLLLSDATSLQTTQSTEPNAARRSMNRLRSTSQRDEGLTTTPSSSTFNSSPTASVAASALCSALPSDGSHNGSDDNTEVARLVTPVTLEVERMLHDAENNWAFDIFAYAEATKGYGLSLMTFHFLQRSGLVREFHVIDTKLKTFLVKIEAGYDSANPYHNSTHVTSVVQMTHMMMHHGGLIRSGAFSRSAMMASYWAAVTHDYEHGGLNNDFLIKTLHPLAITYNDQSPLENHHLAAATRLLLLDPSCQYMPPEVIKMMGRSEVKGVVISQVLGTDMKKHFDITSRFQAAFKRPAAAEVNSKTAADTKVDWDSIKPEDKTLVHQMVLKCADIGHLAAPPRTHRRWAVQLEEEFFRQGDREKALGMPVSPLMDRSQQGGMTRSQLGFFSIVGLPLFKALVDLFEDARPMLDGVNANYRHWEAGTELNDLPV